MIFNGKIEEEGLARIRWLMFGRVAIVTFLLGAATFFEVRGMSTLLEMTATNIYKIIIVTYLLSLFYLFLLRCKPDITLNVYLQGVCDITLITTLIYATGGINSIYSVFYPLVIIYSVIFLERRGGYIIASIASIFYGVFANLEFYGVIYPLVPITQPYLSLTAAYVLSRILTHVISFYLVAFLASFAVAQEKKARSLLAEKQSAFEQLDLLHRSIIESIETGIITVDLKGRIKSLNRAAEEITHLSLPEVENAPILEVFPNQQLLEMINADKSAQSRFEIAMTAPGGRNVVIGGSVSPLRDPHGVTIGKIIIFQDLTSINEMKESLEKSKRLALIGEMAAGLAHEIRNPLASISGAIQMLRTSRDGNEIEKRLMDIIMRSKEQLENFLKDFLLMAKTIPGVREEVDLNLLIKETLESLRTVDDWHEPLNVRVSLPDSPLTIYANRNEIKQVIWNIVLNAIQAMPNGGRLEIKAFPYIRRGQNGIAVEVGDTGVGIEKENIPKIFEPFYTTREVGTGLGLAVVQRIVEGYKGAIEIESEKGERTLCKVWLPKH